MDQRGITTKRSLAAIAMRSRHSITNTLLQYGKHRRKFSRTSRNGTIATLADANADFHVSLCIGGFADEVRRVLVDSSIPQLLEEAYAPSGFCNVESWPENVSAVSASYSIPLSDECPLCLDKKEDLSCTPCGHVFCTPCIHNALHTDSRCPLCRKDAWTNDLRRACAHLVLEA